MIELFFKSFFCSLERLDSFLDICITTRNKKKTLCETLNWFFECVCNSRMNFTIKGDSMSIFESIDMTITSSQMNKDELTLFSYMKDNWRLFFNTRCILEVRGVPQVVFKEFKFADELAAIVKPHVICGRLVALLMYNFALQKNQRDESYLYTAWLIIYSVIINFRLSEDATKTQGENHARRIDFLVLKKIMSNGIIKILNNDWNPQSEYYPV